jgi:hypothetical protein
MEFRNLDQPWPDDPPIPDLRPYDPNEEEDEDEEPTDEDIEEEDNFMLRRQRLFRWAAQAIAISWSTSLDVQKVAAFGAVAQPLRRQVPCFRRYRRRRIEILHECADLDLAVWLTTLDNLKSLKNLMARALNAIQNTPSGGVAHHQVDVHVFDSEPAGYRGRLCYFGQCPKEGKMECLVPHCGEELFLRQFRDYCFRHGQFEIDEPKVILFDRAGGFLVRPPKIEGNLRKVLPLKPRPDEDDDDVDE